MNSPLPHTPRSWRAAFEAASLALLAVLLSVMLTGCAASADGDRAAPRFTVYPSWPQPLPNNFFMADGRNNQVLTLLRETGEVQGTLGRPGRHAGEFH